MAQRIWMPFGSKDVHCAVWVRMQFGPQEVVIWGGVDMGQPILTSGGICGVAV